MTLVDTSVWIDHFRAHDKKLSSLLAGGDVVCHPFVVGEIALGAIRNRAEILELLQDLPAVEAVPHEVVLEFVADERLWGTGSGWIDVHLLAAARAARAAILTNDTRLARQAIRLGLMAGG